MSMLVVLHHDPVSALSTPCQPSNTPTCLISCFIPFSSPLNGVRFVVGALCGEEGGIFLLEGGQTPGFFGRALGRFAGPLGGNTKPLTLLKYVFTFLGKFFPNKGAQQFFQKLANFVTKVRAGSGATHAMKMLAIGNRHSLSLAVGVHEGDLAIMQGRPLTPHSCRACHHTLTPTHCC